MSFSDPFNRVSSKQEKEYQTFLQQLRETGIDTEEKANTVLQQSRINMLMLGAVVIVVVLLVALIWPELMGIIIVFGGLILTWLMVTMARGHSMMKRFIQQEFSGKPDNVK